MNRCLESDYPRDEQQHNPHQERDEIDLLGPEDDFDPFNYEPPDPIYGHFDDADEA